MPDLDGFTPPDQAPADPAAALAARVAALEAQLGALAEALGTYPDSDLVALARTMRARVALMDGIADDNPRPATLGAALAAYDGARGALREAMDELHDARHKARQYDSVVEALRVTDGGRYRADTLSAILTRIQRSDALLSAVRPVVWAAQSHALVLHENNFADEGPPLYMLYASEAAPFFAALDALPAEARAWATEEESR